MTPIIIIVCVVTGVSCSGASYEEQAESSPPGLYTKADARGQAVAVSL